MTVFVTGGSGFLGGHLLDRLAERGDDVRALARSDESAAAVERRGATPVRGDLSDVDAMTEGMRGCELVVHAAAKLDDIGPRSAFLEVNVHGTENVIEAARSGDVERLVHVSTEAVLADGSPIVRADESTPIPDSHAGLYPETKAMAERLVLEANGPGLQTMAVRPRFVWGPGDETLLPTLVEAIESGQFRWFDGGRYLTSTCHVQNAVEGILRAAEQGSGGEAYFVTDGEPVEYREFITRLVRTKGVDPPEASSPTWLMRWVAAGAEFAWRTFPLSGAPPVTKTMIALSGHEVTVDDSKARAELGYEPVISRDEGLEALRAANSDTEQ